MIYHHILFMIKWLKDCRYCNKIKCGRNVMIVLKLLNETNVSCLLIWKHLSMSIELTFHNQMFRTWLTNLGGNLWHFILEDVNTWNSMEFFQHGGVFKRLMQFAQTIYFPLVHHKIEFPPSSGKNGYFQMVGALTKKCRQPP